MYLRDPQVEVCEQARVQHDQVRARGHAAHAPARVPRARVGERARQRQRHAVLVAHLTSNTDTFMLSLSIDTWRSFHSKFYQVDCIFGLHGLFCLRNIVFAVANGFIQQVTKHLINHIS